MSPFDLAIQYSNSSLRGIEPADQVIELFPQSRRQTIAELCEMLFEIRDFRLPGGQIEAQELFDILRRDLQAVEIDIALIRQVADGCLSAAVLALKPLAHPFEHAAVVAEARPEPFAAGALPEPVDVEDARRLVSELVTHVEPVLKVVRHVVTAKRRHRERVAPEHANLADDRRGRFRGGCSA